MFKQAASLIFLLSFQMSFAQTPSALSYDVNTTESIVEINTHRYRKVEYKGDIFFLKLLESEATESDLDFACGTVGDIKTENQILISTRVTKRSSLFIEGLRKTCSSLSKSRQHAEIDPNIQIGFLISDDSSRSVLKRKKIYFNPLKSLLGLSAEF